MAMCRLALRILVLSCAHIRPCGCMHMQLQDMTRDADPRLSFSTPEFKEAQRAFTDGFKVQ